MPPPRLAARWLQPSCIVAGPVTAIDPQVLWNQGIRGLVLDVDRTLAPRRQLVLPETVRRWVARVRRQFKVHLLSNNLSRRRIAWVAKELDLPYCLAAGKPSRSSLRQVLKTINLPPAQVAMVGDRLFTDVVAGNRMGMMSLLVQPIAPDGRPSHQDRLYRLELRLLKALGLSTATDGGNFASAEQV
ncbi:MAG: YqeG family HAD IIIA-type phosphatase [Synechococcus sp. SB0668_bin_15]|nr:YqeG family HAD IIIA-type phosphatase [Synechococcus sp. SB0668_bin_15]MXZ83831.1 YqeG family HAD IIIA-type phosphatase [Synechococcus sp. SB0666_bin_14]MYA91484.1 YqeG family HAD IIIA-type phosphatase [Synechococcus sp. SB0663_bin_10]MYC50078.1 YqeG family HAD IIIA-type phosphatase [Synechococcus sp. SB0662_bin_14]MYG46801.1 YqeG family HAD IIIA-type phosphatase [Synechococcus sp. SB0675_bin_6]MYJ59040.1 YqeG family HAD IIIA-type phosphatase [Synechococcus sp. SB0672_bin_6]MYK90781.1 YqeG